MKPKHDVAVLGGGIAGLTAALHAAERGARVLLYEAGLFGGLVANVGEVEGFPAARPHSGMELAMALLEQAKRRRVEVVETPVDAVEPGDGRQTVRAGGTAATARAVVVATGARLKTLGVPGEERLRGRGVSQCAWCDAGFFKGAEVAVVGGGDAALQEALHLAGHAARVTLVHRGPRPRAKRGLVARAGEQSRIVFRWNSVVEEVLGEAGVEGLRLRGLRDGSASTLAVAGVFPFIGLTANAAMLPADLPRDPDGFLAVDAGLRVAPGIFAVGAVRQGHGGHLTEAVGDASRAAAAAASG